jgi:RimJ/RimL family protein N-acetyltransferase
MIRNWPLTFPVISTQRLELRALIDSDLNELVERCNFYEISKQTSSLPYPYTLEFAQSRLKLLQSGFLDRSRLVWVIVLKQTNEIIGEIGIHWREESQSMEVGYWISVGFWGKGYATESLKEVLQFGKEEKIARFIYGTHFTDNPASGRTMRKSGMQLEGEEVSIKNQEGILKNLNRYIYSLEL